MKYYLIRNAKNLEDVEEISIVERYEMPLSALPMSADYSFSPTAIHSVKLDPMKCTMTPGEALPKASIEEMIAKAAAGGHIGSELSIDQYYEYEPCVSVVCYDRYNPVSEEWERKTTNGLYIVDEETLANLKSKI